MSTLLMCYSALKYTCRVSGVLVGLYVAVEDVPNGNRGRTSTQAMNSLL